MQNSIFILNSLVLDYQFLAQLSAVLLPITIRVQGVVVGVVVVVVSISVVDKLTSILSAWIPRDQSRERLIHDLNAVQ